MNFDLCFKDYKKIVSIHLALEDVAFTTLQGCAHRPTG